MAKTLKLYNKNINVKNVMLNLCPAESINLTTARHPTVYALVVAATYRSEKLTNLLSNYDALINSVATLSQDPLTLINTLNTLYLTHLSSLYLNS
jgi:hypothetical protein